MLELTYQQDRAMQVFRAIDVILERALRAEPGTDECLDNDTPTVRSELIDLQIENVDRAARALVQLGVASDEQLPELHAQLALGFAEYCELVISREAH